MDMEKEFARIKAEVKEEVRTEMAEQKAKAEAEREAFESNPFNKKLLKYKK
ncbi:MAG TPA: hypothetical protein VK094_08800 [Pseudogracilibacillus sp.]|nr:hypothetical protein [Pseudogracilibacillus sp.]